MIKRIIIACLFFSGTATAPFIQHAFATGTLDRDVMGTERTYSDDDARASENHEREDGVAPRKRIRD